MGLFLFFLLAILCVGSVLGMIISKNQAYNALFLVLAFACLGGLFGRLGGLFGLLNAPFIAAVQIIIYAGAIMVLFIFVIMMINLRRGLPPERKKWTLYLAGILALFLLIELILSLKGSYSFFKAAAAEKIGSPTDLGHLLFTKYLYPFEITSILIIAGLVGAIVLAKKREKE